MRRSLIAAVTVAASSAAVAGDDLDFRFEPSVVSNYLYDGISQSWNRPAAQVEMEVEHDLGIYAGAFASTISPRQFPGGAFEAELWAGYEYQLSAGASLSGEIAYYAFPNANLSKGQCEPAVACPAQSFDTSQLRVAAKWNWVTLEVAYALSDYFGASAASGFSGSTRGTMRYELTAERPLFGAWDATARLGYTHYPSALVTQILPGNNGGGADYWLAMRRRFTIDGAPLYLQFGVAGTPHGTTAMSLTDGARTRLGSPAPWVGVSLELK